MTLYLSNPVVITAKNTHFCRCGCNGKSLVLSLMTKSFGPLATCLPSNFFNSNPAFLNLQAFQY
ncbi:hypothetical protein HZS_2095 [Henneguya salminicola]|nr:hypothetical protein HZS_2095 [Henneguya salminicola]